MWASVRYGKVRIGLLRMIMTVVLAVTAKVCRKGAMMGELPKVILCLLVLMLGVLMIGGCVKKLIAVVR